MPVSFRKLKSRTRTVRVPVPDANGAIDEDVYLEIVFKPEAIDNALGLDQRRFQREVLKRQREADALTDPLDQSQAQDTLDQYQITEGTRLLLRVISAWDMFEDDDMTVPMPLTAENFERLGALTIAEIQRLIMQQVQPNPNGSSGSGVPSSQGSEERTRMLPPISTSPHSS